MPKKSKPKKKVVLNQRIVDQEMTATLIADYIDNWAKYYCEDFFPKDSPSREAIGALYLRTVLPEVARAVREGAWRK